MSVNALGVCVIMMSGVMSGLLLSASYWLVCHFSVYMHAVSVCPRYVRPVSVHACATSCYTSANVLWCVCSHCWCVCPAGMCIFRYVRPVVCASCSVCHVRVSMYVLCLLHGGLIVSIILTGILQVEND